MKVTTVREIVQSDGNKTTITIENNLSDADENQLERHLESVGFYDSVGWMRKLKRMLMGKG